MKKSRRVLEYCSEGSCMVNSPLLTPKSSAHICCWGVGDGRGTTVFLAPGTIFRSHGDSATLKTRQGTYDSICGFSLKRPEKGSQTSVWPHIWLILEPLPNGVGSEKLRSELRLKLMSKKNNFLFVVNQVYCLLKQKKYYWQNNNGF